MVKRKKRLILILLLCLPLTVGAKILDVELRGTDKDNPLVNLEAIIQLGGQFASGKADATVPDHTDTGKETETDAKTGGKEAPEKDQANTRLIVRISNTNIYVSNKLVGRAIFERTFKEAYKAGMGVELQDDYAEYNTYLDIKKYLKDNKVSFIERTIK